MQHKIQEKIPADHPLLALMTAEEIIELQKDKEAFDKKMKEALFSQLKGNANQAQIDEWKKANPDGIYAVTCEGRIGYFRLPNMTHMNYALSKQDNSRKMDKWKAVAEVTWLGGCDDLLKNDYLFISIVGHIQAKCDGFDSELVNL